MFQRIGDAAIKKDLTNIRKLCAMLDHPEHTFPAIHIAGTNGKGSTSHMLASVFQAAGLRVGLYTSPHYVDFRERIRINGKRISEKEVIGFVSTYKDPWKAIAPSFFEITVIMAFDHFRRHRVDMAIIETGLGGRLDSTNILRPKLSVITNIGFDHVAMLGHTLPAIAAEKAGIIKEATPVIIGEWHPETAPVFKAKAADTGAAIYFASRHLHLRLLRAGIEKTAWQVLVGRETWLSRITCDLTGPYQEKNIRTVLETIWRWNEHFPEQKITKSAIRHGLSRVKSSTGLKGRWMILHKNPWVITDAAHNDHGMKAMLPGLLRLAARKKHFVLGFVSDKDIRKILALFPKDAAYYWCAPNIPRRRPAGETQITGTQMQLLGKAYATVWMAYRAARQAAHPKDLIFVGGSSYVVGDFLGALKKNR